MVLVGEGRTGDPFRGDRRRQGTAATTALYLVCWTLAAAISAAQTPGTVRHVVLRCDPPDARIQPHQSVVVRASSQGFDPDDPTGFGTVDLSRGPASFRLLDAGAGWLSKPFRYQGIYGLPAGRTSREGFRQRLFDLAEEQSLAQDAVLFTASAREGDVFVSATIEGVTGSVRIRVDAGVPRSAPTETVTFGEQPRSNEPYRWLAEHHAPFVAQEIWFDPKSDYLVRFDADGDWRGDNNWNNAPRASSQAYVYYAVIETDTHWFLLYNFFHLRDYSDKCVAGACHENDNEGIVLTVAKDGSRTGRAIAMETLAHNKIYSYRADPRVEGNFHDLDGEMEFYRASHPVVFVHSGGHGVYGPGSHASYSFEQDRFLSGTGVTYVFKGIAERPRHVSDREVGYDLLPIYDHLWLRAHTTGETSGAFSSYFPYRPRGGRPAARFGRLAGAFLGRHHGVDRAKPFWGWHDNETRKHGILATGQWCLDPAYAVTRNLRLPGPVSLRYAFNPFLQDVQDSPGPD